MTSLITFPSHLRLPLVAASVFHLLFLVPHLPLVVSTSPEFNALGTAMLAARPSEGSSGVGPLAACPETCSVCCDQPADTILKCPDGAHGQGRHAFCGSCAQHLLDRRMPCPMCRQVFREVINGEMIKQAAGLVNSRVAALFVRDNRSGKLVLKETTPLTKGVVLKNNQKVAATIAKLENLPVGEINEMVESLQPQNFRAGRTGMTANGEIAYDTPCCSSCLTCCVPAITRKICGPAIRGIGRCLKPML